MENPYSVLGVAQNATLLEVRQRYIELAKLHHPDKLKGVSEEERRHHEEVFKKVSNAYQRIQMSQGDGVGGNSEETYHWREVWASVESMLRDFFVPVETKPVTKTIHSFRMNVTLEEVHCRKVKKLEMILRDEKAPLYVKVNCGDFPYVEVEDAGHTYQLHMVLQPHPHFTLDAKMHLHYTHSMLLSDYIKGQTVRLTGLDGEEMEVSVTPFCNLKDPMVISKRGLKDEGDLYIHLELRPPRWEAWTKMSDEEQESALFSLYQINALFDMNPGVPKPKTI